MYSKFKKVEPMANISFELEFEEKGVKDRINEFYQDCIIRLVRHVKTSFERIYGNYSSSGSIQNKY